MDIKKKLKAKTRKIPLLRSTESVKAEDKVICAKLFALGSAATWLIAEYDPDTEIVYCYADPHGGGHAAGAEWGYTSVDELAKLRMGIIPRVELDLYFKKAKFSECVDADGRIIV